MSKSWARKQLNDICEVFSDGDWIESKDQSSEGIRLIQTGNVGFGEFRDKEDRARFISESTFKRLKCTEVFAGDLLVSRLPDPVGKSCIIPQMNVRMITGVDCTIIRTRKEITPKFLAYYQQSPTYLSEINTRVTGTTRSRISRKNLGKVLIPIPPLAEQKQIVALLDQAFAAIDQAKANIQQNIHNARELFQSKLNEVFSQKGDGWEEKKLGELSFVKSGGTPRRTTKEYWTNGEIPWYSSGELNKVYTEDSKECITQMGLDNSNARLFPKGSLLIGIYDTAALKMSILDRPGAFNQAIVGVEPNARINLLYIMNAINAVKPKLLDQRRGTRQKNLSLQKIKDIEISLPRIEVQNKLVSDVNNLLQRQELLITSYDSKLSSLDELKKSILQRAFSGELTELSEAEFSELEDSQDLTIAAEPKAAYGRK